jgi:hypothetical protein
MVRFEDEGIGVILRRRCGMAPRRSLRYVRARPDGAAQSCSSAVSCSYEEPCQPTRAAIGTPALLATLNASSELGGIETEPAVSVQMPSAADVQLSAVAL